MNSNEITTAIESAFGRFLVGYLRTGGFRFEGRVESNDPRSYAGPTFWSEDDVAFRFALELERELPGFVHLELPLAGYSRSDLEEGEGNSRVDIAVTDMEGFATDDTAAERFKALEHSTFIEVKWLYKGWWGHPQWEMDALGRIKGVRSDLAALSRHLCLGRCSVAAMLIVDEECYFEHHFDKADWPDGVMRLIASPKELQRRGMADEVAERELARIGSLLELDQAKAEKRLAGKKKDRDQAEQLLADRDRLAQNVKGLRVKAFDLAVELGREGEDVEVLELLKKRAAGESGKSWEKRHATAAAALHEAKASRARRFTWEEGDVEIVTGPVQIDPSLELPQEVKDLVEQHNQQISEPRTGDGSDVQS